ncbi:ATP synthase F1 subunit gamma [bacterium]|nr:ATP synthase F1 subunit gamma [bacterium]
MASLASIRKRIKSTKSTQQITKAMKMVAAARLRGAEERLKKARPYAKQLDRLIASLAEHTDLTGWDLINGRENPKKIEFLVLTSDRGLAGGFNSSIIRYVTRRLAEVDGSYDHVGLSFVGRKAHEFFKRRPWPIRHAWINYLRDFDLSLAIRVGQQLIDDFESGKVDEVYIVYNEFVSAISQEIVAKRLVPVEIPKVEEATEEFLVDYKYEPSREKILAELLPRQVNIQLYRAFLESFAAEMGARMTAMDNATKNASDMIDKLTLVYNRTRQSRITVELMEIINGAEALKG